MSATIAAFGAHGQQGQAPTFRAQVDLVRLDVSVYDVNNRPVTGLTASDFTLREDRKIVPIVTLASIERSDPAGPLAGWRATASYDVATNQVADRNLFVLVIDDATLSGQMGRIVDRAQRLARAFISTLSPDDYATVIFTGDNRRAQDFTNDHARLLAALDHVGAPAMPSCLIYSYSVKALDDAAEFLANTPARRKIFVDITRSGLARPASAPCLEYAWAVTARLVEVAQRAHITVFTVIPALHAPRPWVGSEEGLWVRELPRETGGMTIVSSPTDDADEPRLPANVAAIARDMAPVVAASRSYYMLGYASTDPRKFHTVEVTVNRPGLRVRTRNKYYPPDEKPAGTGAAAGSPAAGAIANLLPVDDLPMEMSLAPFLLRGTSTPAIVVTAGVRQPVVAHERLDFRVALFTAEGAPRGSQSSSVDVQRRPGISSTPDPDLVAILPVPKPGLYEVRVGANSQASGIAGSVFQTIAVPDFTHAAVSLSGVLLGHAGPRTSSSASVLAGLAPVAPTTARSFKVGEGATAFARVYEGGNRPLAPISVRIQVLDTDDREVFERTLNFAPAQFSQDRSADVRVDVPTALPEGSYLMTVDAALDKASSHRDVRFRIGG